MAVTRILVLTPGTTVISLAVACPSNVPFVRMLMSTKGTVALYSVGLVKFTIAVRVNDVLPVSKICKLPIFGVKEPTPPRLMAARGRALAT